MLTHIKQRFILGCVGISSLFTTPTWACHKFQALFNTTQNYNSNYNKLIPSRTKYWELDHTTINIGFNMAEKTANCTTIITLSPYFYPQQQVILDAVGFKINKVTDIKSGLDLKYQYDGKLLSIDFAKTIAKGDMQQIEIQYVAQPYSLDNNGHAAIHADYGLYFINTAHQEPFQPLQIWTQGEIQSNSHWFPTFDSPNFRSKFTLNIEVPKELKTVSNGLLTKSVNKGAFRVDTWEQKDPIPPYLVMMAISDFATASTKWNNKVVDYYVPKSYASTASEIFNHTPEMLEFYSNLLQTPFPWDKYSQVGVYDYVSGAMENVSASLFGSFNLKDKEELLDEPNDFIVAHELFHQWFGDLVTCESWNNLTLNESFADYGEYLWIEHKYGATKADLATINAMRRYSIQAEFNDASLFRTSFNHPGEMFDRISYNKGGRTLHYMRDLMGDEAFFKTLHVYLQQNKGKSAEVAQLRMAAEEVTGQDWNWFFNEWYFKAGHPELAIDYNYNDQKEVLEVVVTQIQEDSNNLYYLPLKADVIYGDAIERQPILVLNQKETILNIPYKNGLKPRFIPDATNVLIGTIKDNKNDSHFYTQLTKTSSFYTKYKTIQALSKRLEATKDMNEYILKSYHYALESKDKDLVRTTLETIDFTKPYFNSFFKKVLAIAQNEMDRHTLAAAIKSLGTSKDKKYESLYVKYINNKSYLVKAEAAKALFGINPVKAYDVVSKLPNQHYNGAFQAVALEIIAQNRKSSDFSRFEDIIFHNFDKRRTTAVDAYVKFLKNIGDQNVRKNGITFLENIAQKNPENYKQSIEKALKTLH